MEFRFISHWLSLGVCPMRLTMIVAVMLTKTDWRMLWLLTLSEWLVSRPSCRREKWNHRS